MTDFFWVGLAVGLPVGAALSAIYVLMKVLK